MAVRPNLLVIGAAKSGTSSLHWYLDQHPDIYMSRPKETQWFLHYGEGLDWRGPGDLDLADQYITSADAYEVVFEPGAGCSVVGESSPMYMYDDAARQRIGRDVPDAQLVAVLRDPVERAFSNYTHLRRDGKETLSFEEALGAEEERLRKGWRPFWGYVRLGRYAEALEPWMDRTGVHILTLEDLKREPTETMQRLFRHLGVEDRFTPDTSRRHNISGDVRSRLVHRRLKKKRPLGGITRFVLPGPVRERLRRRLHRRNMQKPEMSPATRARLIESFRDDTARLEAMLGRTLPWSTSEAA